MKDKKTKKRRRLVVLACVAVTLIGLYLFAVYSQIPAVKFWRTIYIETVMTTGDAQFLAEWFIPHRIIGEVMADKWDEDIIGGGAYLEVAPDSVGADTGDLSDPTGSPSSADPSSKAEDILGQSELTVGGPDMAGNTVLVNNVEEGIVISRVTGDGYKGLVMLIDDPARVALIDTVKQNGEGTRMPHILSDPDILAGINASGFLDPNGEGNGGQVIGLSYDGGHFSGKYMSSWDSVLLTSDHRLVVGSIKNWERYDIRGGMQFGPVLVADGKPQMEGSNGYGIHPRTAIGQRADGVMIFVVIDGRNVLHSLGCTVGDLCRIFVSYGAVNAACCDGGSSSVLGYEGEILNKNCSLNPTFGRRLPNAFVVYRKNR